MNRLLLATAAVTAGFVFWIADGSAQRAGGEDYLSADLREAVDELKKDARATPTSEANIKPRLDTLWKDLVAWIIPKGVLSLVFSTLGVV